MAADRTPLETIEDFLKQKRIALVGISREPVDFSVQLFQELCRHGYDMVPVNPSMIVVLEKKCYPRVQEITPKVDAVLLLTSPEVTDAVVRDCAEAGIRRVWMHRGSGTGAVSPAAVTFCRERGISVVEGECPLMFIQGTGFVHHLHGFLRKISGNYPKPART